MIFYSISNASHGYFHRKLTRPLSEAKFEPNSVYWYDKNDFVPRKIHFKDFIKDEHWAHLRRDPTSKILMFNPDEYFNWYDIEMWATTIKEKNINPNQIYFVVGDENWQEFLIKTFKNFGIEGFHICYFNLLMDRVKIQPKSNDIISRFGMLSRNYQKWRLDFYAQLVKKDLLKNFQYTFNNLMPYGQIKIFDHNEIKTDLVNLGHEIDNKINSWVDGIPYTFDTVAITEKFSDEVYQLIKTSGINIIIESHYDPHYFFPWLRHIQSQEFSIGFPTEKTYKVVASSKPFIMVSTQYFLQEFRRLGFKTFHPYINESYDTIYDAGNRFTALALEIERINNLSDNEFNELLINCQSIADYNLEILKQRKYALDLSKDFNFLKDINLNDQNYHVTLKNNPQREL